MSGDREAARAAARGDDERRWLVPLPRGAEPPMRVFVNGVSQLEGEDYELESGVLAFRRPLAKEGRLGFWRWLSIFLSIAGTYRQNDSVDVHYTVNGQERVATALDIVPPAGHGGSVEAEATEQRAERATRG